MKPTYLSSHRIARLLGVSPSAVLSWIDSGLLTAYRTPGGHRRVEQRALIGFLRAHGMPVPRDLTPVARLLIVDDEEPFLRSATRLLKNHAPRVEIATATGAADGLLTVGTWQPDAVLLDAYMPGMDGIDVCRRLAASPATAHIRVIAISGYASPQLEHSFKQAGALAFLTKPLRVAALSDALGLTPPAASLPHNPLSTAHDVR